MQKIPAAIDASYCHAYPPGYAQRKADVAKAGRVVLDIHNRNLFPDLRAT